jgi:hypothetical protein
MALAISLSFPAGRFHCTPWSHHVNEGVPRVAPFAMAAPAGSGSGMEAQTLDGIIRQCSLARRACKVDHTTSLRASTRLSWTLTALYAVVQERATRQNPDL